MSQSNEMRVIKRDGAVVSYDKEKIRGAMTKAFLAVEGDSATARIHDRANELAEQVDAVFQRRMAGGVLHIEDIQDQVELALMRGEHKVARHYVLYREEHAKLRAEKEKEANGAARSMHVVDKDGKHHLLEKSSIAWVAHTACYGLDDEVDSKRVAQVALNDMYDGISQENVNAAMIAAARDLVEEDPGYAYAAARLLFYRMRSDALYFLNLPPYAGYMDTFVATVHRGVKLGLLDPKMLEFELWHLASALKEERDLQFTYLGLQTLYDRYFLKFDDTRFELPQIFFMRVAMGLAMNEDNPNQRAIEFYNLLSSFDYMCSTPTLFNSGTPRPQLSSCFVSTVSDSLEGIYDAIHDNAMLSKWAGGLGNDWTQVRAMGSHIKGTNGESQGVIPFLKVVNDTAVAVNQGGRRKGAVCSYLETWHLDIEDFLDLRKNVGDDRRRTHDMNTANWVPDLFMKRVLSDDEWTLFSPNDVPDLHDLYGHAFEKRYEEHEARARDGEIKLFKRVKAVELWRKMLSALHETGHPWITFKDSCNLRSPQRHVGVVHSSNLCTEITLNTSEDEIAVCNLGSINLARHMRDGELDKGKLERTVRTAMRMLDNVIDINYYSVDKARQANMRHRPVGLGLMGFQDALHEMRIPYGSDAAVEFADRSMEAIAYHAIEASCDLAKERGSYGSFDGSLWSEGVMPLDSLQLLQDERGRPEHVQVDFSSTMDWDKLRERARKGMRNSNVTAIAPTATIANIVGVSSSIEPTRENIYVKSNLSGEFTVINPHLVRDLKKLGLWDAVMVNDLKYYEGSVRHMDRVPEDLKELHVTAFDLDQSWLVKAASRRQKWIDQAQSLNLYVVGTSGKQLSDLYCAAWVQGLKTTYYLRTKSATIAERQLSNNRMLGVPTSCSIDDPECEACQ